MISRHRIKLLTLALGIQCFAATLFAGERGVPAGEGIGNFGKVSDSLYRGAQPDEAGVKNLKSLGVKTIINLRLARGAEPAEAAQARANGILYTNIPFAGVGRPTDAEVAGVLALISNSPGPVFVHCEHGCDRTGTVIACYRIQHDHWSGDDALLEAEKFGLSRLERGMRHYIADFAASARNQAGAAPAKP
jgi:protein tyrosine/serine phosphatase